MKKVSLAVLLVFCLSLLAYAVPGPIGGPGRRDLKSIARKAKIAKNADGTLIKEVKSNESEREERRAKGAEIFKGNEASREARRAKGMQMFQNLKTKVKEEKSGTSQPAESTLE